MNSIQAVIYCLTLLAIDASLILLIQKRFPRLLSKGDELSSADNLLGLQGLRGVLAISVFFHHASCTYYFLNAGVISDDPYCYFLHLLGPQSVKYFFALSGFLFWSKLMRSKGKLNAVDFFQNRFRRIAPGYYAALALFFVMVFAESGFTLRVPLRENLSAATQWIFFNLPFGHQADINGVVKSWLLGMGVAWTLTLEWMFYLLLPVLGWFSVRNRTPLLLLVSAGIWYGLLQRPILGPFTEPITHFLGAFTFQFSAGVLCAWLFERLTKMHFRPTTLSFVALVSGALFFSRTINDAWYGQYIGVLLLFFSFSSIALGGSIFGILTARPLLFLGKISYSLYLFHALLARLICSVVDHFISFKTMPYLVFCCAEVILSILVIALSYCAFAYVEYPFLKKKKPQSKPADINLRMAS